MADLARTCALVREILLPLLTSAACTALRRSRAAERHWIAPRASMLQLNPRHTRRLVTRRSPSVAPSFRVEPNPRVPDRAEATNPAQKEFRNRFIPSGLDQEILFNAFLRVASFHPGVTRTALERHRTTGGAPGL